MVERFVAIGEDEAQAERNLNRLSTAFGRFIALFSADGRRAVPEKDAEFLVAEGSKDGRPALAMVGTPDQIIDELQQVIDETGARRILIETFSPEETRLFAESVMPVLRERNLSQHATAAASRSMTAAGVRLADQGFFWVGVEFADHEGQAVADGTQLYVEYQVPESSDAAVPHRAHTRRRRPVPGLDLDAGWATRLAHDAPPARLCRLPRWTGRGMAVRRGRCEKRRINFRRGRSRP